MKSHHFPMNRTRQRGAVLFIALMMLIILTLLGLSAAQVTSLQERMAAAYRADRIALENAESRLAQMERTTTQTPASNNILCETLYSGVTQAAAWRRGSQLTTETTVENLQHKTSRFVTIAGGLDAGVAQEIGDTKCLFLQISAHASDGAGDTSRAIVQSIYTP